jgi:hypothetical protein
VIALRSFFVFLLKFASLLGADHGILERADASIYARSSNDGTGKFSLLVHGINSLQGPATGIFPMSRFRL